MGLAMTFPPVNVKTVVITGCSSGIGASAAHLLRERGWEVATTARKPEDLQRLANDGFHAVMLDTAQAESVAGAAGEISRLFRKGVGALVNNAGFGQVGAVEDLTREVLDYQFQVNVIGMQDLTNRLIPGMRNQGFGRIVNISSVLGRVSLPFMGCYAASKFAMEALSDAMRVELRRNGIAVSLVEPGPIVTNFRRNASSRGKTTLAGDHVAHRAYYDKELERRTSQNFKPEPFALGPEAVAEKILHAVTSARPKARYKVTLPAYAGALIARAAPTWLHDRIMARRARTE